MSPLSDHLVDLLLKLSPEDAATSGGGLAALALDVAGEVEDHANDPEALRAAPYGVVRPFDEPLIKFVGGLTSDRLRSESGVVLVLDIPAIMRASEDYLLTRDTDCQ